MATIPGRWTAGTWEYTSGPPGISENHLPNHQASGIIPIHQPIDFPEIAGDFPSKKLPFVGGPQKPLTEVAT